MKKTFTINNFDKHLIIEDNGKTYLIDTGSPSSIFDGESLEFLGQTCHKNNLMSLAARVMPLDISNLLGMHVDALIGNDILKHFAICFDYGNSEITFSDEGLTLPDAVAVPINTSFGVPKAKMSLQGHEGLFFLDTGAKISYVSSATTNGLTPGETDTDFYPGVGDFETPIFNLDTTIADKTFKARYGNLPKVLEFSLMGLSGTKGVIGYDFFNNFKVLIDYRANQLFLTFAHPVTKHALS